MLLADVRGEREGAEMRMVVESATGPSTLPFTAALVVVVCFRLLVALRVTTARGCDSGADLGSLALFAVRRLTRRLVRPLHRLFPDEPGPSRSPHRPGADRDGASRAVRREADGIRPRLPQNRGTG
ncbi:hypothetical protein GCM10010340_16310 [Streptomyces griseoloalbus]|nr:hypothetical protein GCM10010340_16310 [Streptomyces albaduncus]